MESHTGLGSMIQLKALGPQNEYTSALPSTSPYIRIYKRHFEFSNFQKIVELRQYKFGQTIRVDIDNKTHGDLTDEVIFKCTLSRANVITPWWYTDSIGHALIEKVELKIGTVTIDTIDGDWLEVYDNEFLTGNKYDTMSELVQRGKGNTLGNNGSFDIWVPLRFYFDRKKGLSFPFCALPHQRVQIVIYTRPAEQVINTTAATGNLYGTDSIKTHDGRDLHTASTSLIFNEYILEDHLRQYFASHPLGYLVKTNRKAPPIQFDHNSNFSESTNFRYYPDTNATVSLFTWGFRSNVALAANTVEGLGNDRFNFSNAVINAGVFLENKWVDELKIGDRKYWRYLQPLMNLPSCPKKELYNWSLGLHIDPLDEQDTGGTDFSKVKGRSFFFEFNLDDINYEPVLFMSVLNYLKIENGSIESFFIY